MSAAPRPVLADLPIASESLTRKLFSGVSALMVSTSLERGLTFLAHLAAARLGGASTFGGYSLALTTANNIASYAGAGIGSTATRFAGSYGQDPAERRTLGRALLLVAFCSALLGSALLVLGAGPLARLLLHKPDLALLLRWAALPAAATILMECYRGYLIGQRNFQAQIRLAAIAGISLLFVLPAAALLGPVAMVCSFAAVLVLALGTVLLWHGQPARVPVAVRTGQPGPTVQSLVHQVWHFGFVQLLGVVGLNAAGMWLASLLIRFDSTMVEMGLFAAASQIRNMAGLAPGLFTQSSFGLLADRRNDASQVLGFSTVSAALAVILLAGLGVAVLPWMLPLLYGGSFRGAVLPASLALATAIVHLSNGPSAARLNIVALRATGLINAAWSATVVGLSALMFSHQAFRLRPAVTAMFIYLTAHMVSAVLVFWALQRRAQMPDGMASVIGLSAGAAVILVVLAFARAAGSGVSQQAGWTAAIVFLTLLMGLLVFEAGRRSRWIPNVPTGLLARLLSSFRGRHWPGKVSPW